MQKSYNLKNLIISMHTLYEQLKQILKPIRLFLSYLLDCDSKTKINFYCYTITGSQSIPTQYKQEINLFYNLKHNLTSYIN